MDTGLRWSGGEIDVHRRCVHVNGQAVRPHARAFDLLVALAQGRGAVVPKSTLLDRVWPDQAVEEANLAVQVHALRRLLGRDAVATVPGRGYRLGLPQENGAPPPPPAPAPAAPVGHNPLPPDPRDGMLDREGVLSTLVAAVGRGERVVELVGVGGVGKSTLALAAAHALHARLPRVAWLELATLTDEKALPSAIARSAGLAIHEDDQPARSLALALRDTPLLVVLDGAEHLIEAVARLCATLLPACPGLLVLVTSQVPLPMKGALRVPLGGLSLPPEGVDTDSARQHGAVALFEACGQQARRGFRVDPVNLAAVLEICRRCDGLPYAIELMAASMAMFSPAALAERLRANLPVGRAQNAGAPQRHQSVKDAMAFSHALLPAPEQTLFRRLAVFPASFTAAMAAAVCGDEALPAHDVADALATLVDRCIVVLEPNPPGLEDRYRLLDTGQQFALGLLQASEEEEVTRDRLVDAVLAFARKVEPDIREMGLEVGRVSYGAEFENLLAALRVAGQQPPYAKAVQLLVCSDRHFVCQGRKVERTPLFRLIASTPNVFGQDQELLAGRFWNLAGGTVALSVHSRDAAAFTRRGLTLLRRSGDLKRLHWALSATAYDTILPLPERRACLEEARAIEDNTWARNVAARLGAEAAICSEDDRIDEALLFAQRALETARTCDSILAEDLLYELALLELMGGRYGVALHLAEQAHASGPQRVGHHRGRSVGLLCACHALSGCVAAMRESAKLWELCLRASGWSDYVANASPLLPLLCAREQRWRDAARLRSHVENTWSQNGLDVHSRVWRLYVQHPILRGIDTELDPDTRQRCWQQGQNLHPQQAFDMMLRGTNAVIPAHLMQAEALAHGGLPPWALLDT